MEGIDGIDKKIDLQQLSALLDGISFIDFAMVFGSSADGVVRTGSDLDVAVWLIKGDDCRIDRLLEIVGKIEESFNITCDLTLLNTAGTVLRHEAIKGRVLVVQKGREEKFTEFYVRTCAEYEDLVAWRARQLAYRGYPCPSTVS